MIIVNKHNWFTSKSSFFMKLNADLIFGIVETGLIFEFGWCLSNSRESCKI